MQDSTVIWFSSLICHGCYVLQSNGHGCNIGCLGLSPANQNTASIYFMCTSIINFYGMNNDNNKLLLLFCSSFFLAHQLGLWHPTSLSLSGDELEKLPQSDLIRKIQEVHGHGKFHQEKIFTNIILFFHLLSLVNFYLTIFFLYLPC